MTKTYKNTSIITAAVIFLAVLFQNFGVYAYYIVVYGPFAGKVHYYSSRIKLGMSSAELESIFGPADAAELLGGIQTWRYLCSKPTCGDMLEVIFADKESPVLQSAVFYRFGISTNIIAGKVDNVSQ